MWHLSTGVGHKMWHHEGMTPEEHRENLRRIAAVRDSSSCSTVSSVSSPLIGLNVLARSTAVWTADGL